MEPLKKLGIPEMIGLVLIALAVGTLGCTNKATADKPSETVVKRPAAKPVALTPVQLRDWPATVRVQGSLHGDEQAVIGAKVAGRVKVVKVEFGTVVQAGDVIAQLDPEEFDLQVKQAEAQLEQVRAKVGLKPGQPDDELNPLKSPPVLQEKALLEEARANLDRTEQLHRQGTVTTAELHQREAALSVAEARFEASLNSVDEQIALLGVRKAELALAREHQSEATVKAPFTGVIQERRVAPGVYVRVGDPMVTLVRTHPLRFRTGVPEREALNVHLGQPVQIVIEGIEKPIDGKICRISPALDLSSRSLWIEVDVPNAGGQLRAGLFAEADIVVDPDQKLLAVPADSIIEFAGIEKVWLVQDGQLKERRVNTGRRARGLVEVLGGVGPGERIALDASRVRGNEQAVPDEIGLASGPERSAQGQSE